MSRKATTFIASAAFGTMLAVTSSAEDLRDRQTQACMGDAFRLCGDAIPDESRIEACMNAKRSELNPGCRVFFTDVSVKADESSSSKSSAKTSHIRLQSASVR